MMPWSNQFIFIIYCNVNSWTSEILPLQAAGEGCFFNCYFTWKPTYQGHCYETVSRGHKVLSQASGANTGSELPTTTTFILPIWAQGGYLFLPWKLQGGSWKSGAPCHFLFQLYVLFKTQINSTGSNFYPDPLKSETPACVQFPFLSWWDEGPEEQTEMLQEAWHPQNSLKSLNVPTSVKRLACTYTHTMWSYDTVPVLAFTAGQRIVGTLDIVSTKGLNA